MCKSLLKVMGAQKVQCWPRLYRTGSSVRQKMHGGGASFRESEARRYERGRRSQAGVQKVRFGVICVERGRPVAKG
jgi:hypothetical protein